MILKTGYVIVLYPLGLLNKRMIALKTLFERLMSLFWTVQRHVNTMLLVSDLSSSWHVHEIFCFQYVDVFDIVCRTQKNHISVAVSWQGPTSTIIYPSETNSSHLKIGRNPNRKVVFQPSIFRGGNRCSKHQGNHRPIQLLAIFLVFQPFFGRVCFTLAWYDIDLSFHVMTSPDFIHRLLVLKRSECLITVAANTAQGEMAQKL